MLGTAGRIGGLVPGVCRKVLRICFKFCQKITSLLRLDSLAGYISRITRLEQLVYSVIGIREPVSGKGK